MAFKLNEASSSLIPPDKKTTPTKAGGTVLLKAMQVLVAIYSAVILALSGFLLPGVTMFGFNKQPSKNILLSAKHLKTSAKTLSVTF
jgi:hypothetical protein